MLVTSLIPHPSSLIPHPSSLIPHPSSLIPHPRLSRDKCSSQKRFKFLVVSTLMIFSLAAGRRLSAQQTTQCNFPTGQSTLCKQSTEFSPQINVLTPASTSAWPNGWSNTDVYINAILTVNTSFNIFNSTLQFGPNGKIVLVSGGHLSSSASRYFSCNPTGWAGIRVEGAAMLNFNDNQIEDALYAIDIASNTAQSVITANIFNRNITDIYIGANIAANALIVGNRFECSSNTFANNRSENGILVQQSGVVTVGIPQTISSLEQNVFVNHKRGIYNYAAVTNIRSTEFACNTEYGIYSPNGGTVNIRGNQYFRNRFFRNKADISVSATNLQVYDSDFRQCLTDNIMSNKNFNAQDIKINGGNTIEIDNDNTYIINANNGLKKQR